MKLASILIVNFNGGHHLASCLSALQNQTVPKHRFEVIVLDNNSQDGSVEHLSARFNWVRWIRSRKNLGFALGNNVAARHAHGEIVVLLNNDTIPDPFWLEELLRAMDVYPGHRLASKLVFADRPHVLNSTGLYLLRDGRGADRGFECIDDGCYEAGGPIFAGCGAAVVVRNSSENQIFDPDYFLYAEDLDAGWREQLDNVPAVLVPRSLVRHVHGAAAGEKSPIVRFHVERNRALACLRNGDFFLALWSAFVLMAKIPQSLARAAMGRIPARNAFAVVRAFISYLERVPGTLIKRYTTRYEFKRGPRGMRCVS